MPELQQFTADTMPDHFGWQILDFVRIHWFDIFAHEKEAAVHPAMWHPTYFIIAEQRALYSNATVVWQDITVNGQPYRAYGLSSVLTYPAFRKQGYGSRVVTAATEFIKAQADADLAILWTDPPTESFYTTHGFVHPTDFFTTSGDPAAPEPTHFSMLMFLSASGQRLQQALAGGSLYFGEHTW